MYRASFQGQGEVQILHGDIILNKEVAVGHVVDSANIGNSSFVLLIEVRIDSDLNNLTLSGINLIIGQSEIEQFSTS
jgi:hypothetical protein